MTYKYISIVPNPQPLDALIGKDMEEVTPTQAAINAEVKLAEAAPELLEALHGLVSVYDTVTMGQKRERREEWLPKARALLKKVGV